MRAYESAGDPLDARQRARRRETRARRPNRTEADTRAAASTSCCRHRCHAFSRLLAQAGWRHPVARVERVVEPAQAGKAAGKGDLGHRQGGLGQQLLRQEQAARQQQLDRRHAELLLDDAANLPRAQLELVGDFFEPGLFIESAFFEALDDQLRDALRIVHRRAARRQLGPAAQARTKAGLLGLLGGVEEPAVGFLRRLHRADRPAVDASRRHADEEDAVEARVARRQRLVEPTWSWSMDPAYRGREPD